MSEKFDTRDKLLMIGAFGVVTIILGYTLLSLSQVYFDNWVISALTAFGVAISGFTSFLLVAIYLEQTSILERHGNILDKQAELMSLEYVPNISTKSKPDFDRDQITIKLTNRAKGTAINLSLVTRVEFDDSQSISYNSPMVGRADMMRVEKERVYEDQTSLEPHGEGEFQTNATLFVKNNQKQRPFHVVMDNLSEEGVNRVRIELKIKADGQQQSRQEEVSCNVVPEGYFYVDLKKTNDCHLAPLYRSSSPSQV